MRAFRRAAFGALSLAMCCNAAFFVDHEGRLEGETCQEKCAVAGHCCVGNVSACQKPSCAMGCVIAQVKKTFDACNKTCYAAQNQCNFKLQDGTVFQQCSTCPERWLPPGNGTPGWWPPGYQLPTCTSCDDTKDECLLGCMFATNPGTQPQKPTLAPTPAPRPTPPVPADQPLNFSWTLGDHAVLQRAPAASAVYGFLGSATHIGSAAVSVTVAADGGAEAPYTVEANVSGSTWKALLKPTASVAGKTYTVTATCTAGCKGTATMKDVVFGEVWYCAGQSNMALPVRFTYHQNKSRDAIIAGQYHNIRLQGLKGNMNADQPWIPLAEAVATPAPTPGTASPVSPLMAFSSTCYYFGESLSDGLGKNAPPIGLIHTAWGGSMIEEWVTDDVAATCDLANRAPHNEDLWDRAVRPYLDMTVAGFVWYQGENNCGTLHGNSATSTGYGCLMPKMIDLWRSKWSEVPGTTPPDAPFGVVSLSTGDSEGSPDIASFRWSQGGNYGVVPNPVMPRAFLAHAYDLEDVWSGGNGAGVKCNSSTVNPDYPCDTPWFMGPGIHPRLKKPVGMRLALGAMATAYGAAGPVTGPTVSGCSVSGAKLSVRFNASLLAGGKLQVLPYDKTDPVRSAFFVLVNDTDWVSANVALAGPTTVTADLSSLAAGSAVTAIRYAWGDPTNPVGGDVSCCHGLGDFCPIARCPIVAQVPSALAPAGVLPGNPFIAKVVGGRCECPPPQVCDQ